jgi:hypothetical protein
MAVSVVDGALLRVGQHGVGLTDLLKPLLRVGVVGIAVGMVLERQFAVGTLEFEVSDGAGNAENLVIIAFCVCRQKWLVLEN